MAVPLRTCVGCRRKASAAELVRVVLGPSGDLHVGRHLPGRGAWLCAGPDECLEAAIRRRAFGRAFRAEVGAAAVEGLRTSLASRGRMGQATQEPVR
ncbi:MAG: YlxR family protein [Acidimicrobiales bacterium]